METELRDRVRTEAERHALYNALKYGGDPQVNSIIGPMMGENPEFRDRSDEVVGIVQSVVEEVAALSVAEQLDRLGSIDQNLLDDLDQEEESDQWVLSELPGVESVEQVRMRVAPNPNGPWHLGHARMPAVIGTYKDRYDGWFACRFDDTDPETKRPDLAAYDQIVDDIEYLGFDPDVVEKASDRLETYYDYGFKLIDNGGGYTCSCPADEFSGLKNAGEVCPHREKAVETVRSEFEGMVAGEYDAGEMVLRVLTDIQHKNPAVRDWVAFRLVDTPHPRPEAADYRCWPMLDFQSGIDDFLLNITHIIRGIDLQDSEHRQQYLYDYFGWEYPAVIHWGHVQVDEYDVQLSTSSIRELIESGDLEAWDDPQAPTIMSLRRRGILGEAIVSAMIELGTSTSNVELAMSSIYAKNRESIDLDADRLFFVRDGTMKPVIGGPDVGEPPIHPERDTVGARELPVGGGVLVETVDVPSNGQRVWLKGFGCVRHTRDAFEYTGDDISVVREQDVNVIHWVPAEENRRLRLRTMDGDVIGYAERSISEYGEDEVVQFERIGFARIDMQSENETVAYFAHS